jgi:hypothetical protein
MTYELWRSYRIYERQKHIWQNGVTYIRRNEDYVGWDSVVGITTRYGLGGLEIEPRLGQDCMHPTRQTLRPHSASNSMGTGSSWVQRGRRRGVDHPPNLTPRLKKEQDSAFTPHLGLRGLL